MNARAHLKNSLYALSLLAALTLCSCASEPPQQEMAASRAYNIPPSQLMEALPAALAAEPMKLGVAKEQNGTLQTTWKEDYRGTFHIARYWQERTRFEVSVIPDWQAPQAASRLDIREETEERSNHRSEWRHNADVARPERAADLLKQVDASLAARGVFLAPAVAGAPAAFTPATPLAQAAPTTPLNLGDARPAATTWDAANGTGALSLTSTLAAATGLVRAECQAADLTTLYERATDKQTILQVRKGNGPIITILAEPRPGNLTRITLRQPAGDSDSTGSALFQALQSKRPATR